MQGCKQHLYIVPVLHDCSSNNRRQGATGCGPHPLLLTAATPRFAQLL
jgi:hypothetical protein